MGIAFLVGGCQGSQRSLRRASCEGRGGARGRQLRRTLRVFATSSYDPADFEKRADASPGDDSYPKYGLSVNETFIQIVEEELGDKLGPLGRSWVCEAWQSETCLELKLRGLMEQLSRILTIGAVTTKEHVDQALAALERELARAPGSTPAAGRGRVARRAPPRVEPRRRFAAGGRLAAAAADGADVRGGAPSRTRRRRRAAARPRRWAATRRRRCRSSPRRGRTASIWNGWFGRSKGSTPARRADDAPAGPLLLSRCGLPDESPRGVSPDLKGPLFGTL